MGFPKLTESVMFSISGLRSREIWIHEGECGKCGRQLQNNQVHWHNISMKYINTIARSFLMQRGDFKGPKEDGRVSGNRISSIK